MRTLIWKSADILVTGLIALVIGVLFPWWAGAVAFSLGLALVFWPKTPAVKTVEQPSTTNKEQEASEWLEEWHDDMRRRQIGPYEWRD